MKGLQLKLLSLEERRNRQNLIEVFKILCKGIRFDEWGKGSKAITLLN